MVGIDKMRVQQGPTGQAQHLCLTPALLWASHQASVVSLDISGFKSQHLIESDTCIASLAMLTFLVCQTVLLLCALPTWLYTTQLL